MRLIRHRGKSDCGVCVVATILNLSWKDACVLIFGTTNPNKCSTQTKHLVRAVQSYGYKVDKKLRCANSWDKVPPNSIVKMRNPNRKRGNWHWVVWDGKKVWDNEHKKSTDLKNYVKKAKFELSSYIQVTK